MLPPDTATRLAGDYPVDIARAEVHPGLAAAARLRRVAAALSTGTHPSAEDATWLAGRLGVYLTAETDLDLDGVLGLLPPPGGSSWRTAVKHAERDKLLRELAGPGPGRVLPRAQELQQRLRRYGASSWPRDRVNKSPSAVNAILYRIFCLDPEPPSGISRLRQIIGE